VNAPDIARLTWELEQRRLIEETLLDYARFVDRNDPVSLAGSVFCEDGQFELGSEHAVVGRAELERMFAKTLSAFSRTSHHVSNIRIRFVADEVAESSAYVYAWHIDARDGRRIDLWGRYHDTLRLTEEGWRIARRHLSVAGTDGWVDPPFELTERLPSADDLPSPTITRTVPR